MALGSKANKVVSKSTALMIAIIVGAVTLLAVIYIMPEVADVIAEVEGEEGVDLTGFDLLTTLGPILLVLGALIGLLIMIFMSVVDVAS